MFKTPFPMLIGFAVILTGYPALAEEPASAGPLDLTRRIVASSGAAGEDSAGYVRIRNGSLVSDELIDASCACADSIEFHRIVRTASGGSVNMPSLAQPP